MAEDSEGAKSARDTVNKRSLQKGENRRGCIALWCPLTKQCRSDPHHRAALIDGEGEVPRHTHAKLLDRQGGKVCVEAFLELL